MAAMMITDQRGNLLADAAGLVFFVFISNLLYLMGILVRST